MYRNIDTNENRKNAWTEKSAIQNIDFIHKIKHEFDYLFSIFFDKELIEHLSYHTSTNDLNISYIHEKHPV